MDTVTTAAGQFYTHSYTVVVSNGLLQLELKDLGGSDSFAVISALVITS